MGKYYNQAGHYRTYSESGKTISVNGGPKQQYSGGILPEPLGTIVMWLFIIASGWVLYYSAVNRNTDEILNMVFWGEIIGIVMIGIGVIGSKLGL